MDGLGIEVICVSIIELLFKCGFLIKCGRNIYSMEVGWILIFVLFEMVIFFDMIVYWEM